MSRKEELLVAWERVPFLRSLPNECKEQLLPYAELKMVSNGERLWYEGENAEQFSFMIRGRVKLVKTNESGRDTILEMPASGELLCGNAVSCFIPYCCSAECMEDGTMVVILLRRDILALVEQEPEVARNFVREITCRGIHLCERVEELSGGQVEQRIALLLLKLADRAGVPLEGGAIKIRIPLSRQDLADLCGTTVETAIRVMSRLKKLGVVETAARGFLIKNRQQLELVSQGVRPGTPKLPIVPIAK